ncbi:MAG: protein-L-isoaspartate(D-aspartate) O-methyltransferase [Betaproteobacteria bacterium]|nr:protein-L-isoaspartate(D-aspartate) O-methyltransferase [Betaproteobacteria bacterium]
MTASAPNPSGIGMTSQRTRMRMVERLRQQGIRDEIVLSVIGEVPRHLFVDEALAHRAYEDISLPIGFGQTISNPHTVARMTELARAGRDLNAVLEIGTGCGYQCAVLARVAKVVHSVERLVQLTARARKNLRNARVLNVRLRHGDGHAGVPTEAPFDAIVMTAAATHVPKALLEQLAVGGRMIFPKVKGEVQHLWVIERTAQSYTEKRMDAVKFVPLLPGTG